MPLSWNEIRTRAHAFVTEWADEAREEAEAKSFWDDFFKVFGLSRRRVASFEQAVKKASGKQGFIDLFWPGVLLVEHKSRGQDLDKAFGQAMDYFPGLPDEQLPRYVLVSDFARFRLFDLDEGTDVAFPVQDLPSHLERFGFIAGYEKRSYDEQDPVNVEAARQMGRLHDALREAGYDGHDLQVALVRLLFCLFADDTGIFSPRGAFLEFVERSREDGSDLGPLLDQLFDVLNTAPERRQRTLDERFEAFPYVNGRLFAERLRPAAFDAGMRQQLLRACYLDWGAISPAIFGSLFQSVMDPEERRHLGAHYTSEANILKLIGPLFLDGLRAEFERVRSSRAALAAFHDRLGAFRMLDPACGCGNFLVVAYRELRRLELDVLRARYRLGQQELDVSVLLRVDVDQCFGIEIEEFPAQIAQVALWLMDHQMNLEVAAAFGNYFTRLPLVRSAHVLHGNALRVDWAEAFGDDQPEAFNVILGNPPFVGRRLQSEEQRRDLAAALPGVSAAGRLDYVAAWYGTASRYMKVQPGTRAAFVSTNSISQGEQVGILWAELFARYGVKIDFAHRTFRWTNEASGRAAVHVVIVGFGIGGGPGLRRLFEYGDVRGEPHERAVSNINPYLAEGEDIVVQKRREPFADVPPMRSGNKPSDGGHLVLGSNEDRNAFLRQEPGAAPFVRPFIGSDEYINGLARYCLWLEGVPPQTLRTLPLVRERVRRVRAFREASTALPTQRAAATPALFFYVSQPETEYLAVPEVSSENRAFIPMGFLPPETIASNKLFVVPTSSRYLFGVLSSTMHMAWVRHVGGRLESRYSYSGSVIYNTFPWPETPGEGQRRAVEAAAEAVLATRAPFLGGGATLADLYDPVAMPPTLAKAHAVLDRAVDRAYRPQAFTSEANRVAFLFDRYEALTYALFARGAKDGRRRRGD